jgi:hypothetical protein
MLSRATRGEDRTPGVTRPVVRLLVLLGLAVVIYLGLSLFEHAARADSGSVDRLTTHIGSAEPVASVKAGAAGKVAGREADSPKTQRSSARIRPSAARVSKTPRAVKVRAPKAVTVEATKKTQATSTRAGETVRRAHVSTSKVRRSTSHVGRGAARATVSSVRTVVSRHKMPQTTHLGSRLKPVKVRNLPSQVPGLPRVRVPALPQAPGQPQTGLPDLSLVPAVSQAQFPAMPEAPLRALPPMTNLPHAPLPRMADLPHAPLPRIADLPRAELPALPPMANLRGIPLPALPQVHNLPPAGTPVLPQTLGDSSTSARMWTSGSSSVTKPPAAQTESRTTVPARQPADRSAPGNQARDFSSGTGPSMGSVSTPWRPEVSAAGRRLAADSLARGRTVRYAGPPS